MSLRYSPHLEEAAPGSALRGPRTGSAAVSKDARRGYGGLRMDIAAWLQGLGLERYVPAFRDNDVDAEVLPRLTADDLIGLGVASIGHRRKLLDAIAAFGAGGPVITA